MKLGLVLGYWGAGHDGDNLTLAQEADRLGFAVVWVPESWGADVATVLAWVAAQTQRIDVGSGIMQIPARSPSMTAMTAATLDALSGGRFRLGLGISGPAVSEGWHGVRFDAPLARTREYVEIVRAALRRRGPLRYAGRHYQLPLPDGPGRPLTLSVQPVRDTIPLYLGGMGTREQNFYNALARRMGFEEAADRVQQLYLEWEYEDAAAAVPIEFIDQTSLLGPAERIAERMRMHSDAGVTTLAVRPYGASVAERVAALHTAVDAVHRAGVAA